MVLNNPERLGLFSRHPKTSVLLNRVSLAGTSKIFTLQSEMRLPIWDSKSGFQAKNPDVGSAVGSGGTPVTLLSVAGEPR